MRSITSFFILISCTLIYSQSTSPQIQKHKIASLLKEAHKRGFFNGNALVEVDGKIIYQDQVGFADTDRSEKLKPEHIFKIGSISKEFDGVSIMLLNERDKLSLESTVSDHFPSLPAWSKKVTIKHLLQYTSGLPNFDHQKIRTDEQVWEHLKSLDTLEFEPGTGYRYNNLNTFLRKRIVEKVSGQSFSKFVQQNLLTPAGMENAIIDPDSSNPEFVQAFDTEFIQENYLKYMSGWVALNIEDMHNWIESLHSGKILKPEFLLKLFESYNDNQSTLGHSDFQNGKLHYHYHHGQSENYEASYYYNTKDKFTVIFLTNQRGNNLGDLTNAVDAILRGEDFSIPKKSIELSLGSKIYHQGFEAGMEFYEFIKKNKREVYEFEKEEKELLETAEFLTEYNRNEDALRLLEFISEEFPGSDEAKVQLERLQELR